MENSKEEKDFSLNIDRIGLIGFMCNYLIILKLTTLEKHMQRNRENLF